MHVVGQFPRFLLFCEEVFGTVIEWHPRLVRCGVPPVSYLPGKKFIGKTILRDFKILTLLQTGETFFHIWVLWFLDDSNFGFESWLLKSLIWIYSSFFYAGLLIVLLRNLKSFSGFLVHFESRQDKYGVF